MFLNDLPGSNYYRIKETTEALIKYEQDADDYGSINRVTGRFERFFAWNDPRTQMRKTAYAFGQCRAVQRQF